MQNKSIAIATTVNVKETLFVKITIHIPKV